MATATALPAYGGSVSPSDAYIKKYGSPPPTQTLVTDETGGAAAVVDNGGFPLGTILILGAVAVGGYFLYKKFTKKPRKNPRRRRRSRRRSRSRR